MARTLPPRPRRLGAAVAATTVTAAAAVLLSACNPLQQAAKPSPSKAAAELSTGLKLHGEGKLDEAVAHYQAALEADPKNKYALYDLALIDVTRKRMDDAEAKYRLAIAIDPNYGPALFNLALLVKAKGGTDEAIGLYRRAIAVDAGNASAHLNLGILLRSKGDQAGGNAEVQKALSLDKTLKDPAHLVEAAPSGNSSSGPTMLPHLPATAPLLAATIHPSPTGTNKS